jgi:uncharacterized protein YvpB
MGQADKESAPLTLFSQITFLAVVLLAFVGSVAYWRLNSQSWAIYRQVQLTQDSLMQQARELDTQMAAMLRELEALQARIATLEAANPQTTEHGPELSTMRSDILALQSEVSNLDRQLDSLLAAHDNPASSGGSAGRLEATSSPPEGSSLPRSVSLGVPMHAQSHSLSCEATTAVMVADFFDVPLSEEEAIADLPRHENPNLGFRGDIDGPPGGISDYGVHAAPLQEMLIKHGLKATYITDGVEGVRNALNAGHPVIAWVTYRLWQQSPMQLELTDGTTVKVVPYEHTIVIDGYTDDGLWGLDPYDAERQLLPWADFERSWGYLDRMALEISKP